VSRGIALLFLGPRHLRGVGGQPYSLAASTPGKDPVPILQEAGWAPGRRSCVRCGWCSARHHPHRTHDLRSGSQDNHPSTNSMQKTVCCNLLFFLDDCLLSWLDWNTSPTRTTDTHLKRVSTNCCIHTAVPPDDGPRYARNM